MGHLCVTVGHHRVTIGHLRAVTILMLHKQEYFIKGSKNEVISSKICGIYEVN